MQAAVRGTVMIAMGLNANTYRDAIEVFVYSKGHSNYLISRTKSIYICV